MKEPKYSPGSWVVFKLERGGAFGRILGGNYTDDSGWIYYVENVSNKENPLFTVAEVDITAKSDGGGWAKI
ncbi:MAG: hypothetical protein WEC17_03005 [Candidatus Saccharimonadales bacterium]